MPNLHLPEVLFGRCEACEFVLPVEELTERAGLGWRCEDCDDGPTFAIAGMVIATRRDDPLRPDIERELFECGWCEKQAVHAFIVRTENNEAWLRICGVCFLDQIVNAEGD